MKKLLTSLAAILVMSFAASAQESGLGIRGGVNFSNMSFEDISSDTYTGFNVGIVYNQKITEFLYIQPGLFYSTRGAKSSGSFYVALTDTYFEGSDELKMDYLQVPVLASFRLGLTKNIRIALEAGPYFAYGLKGQYKLGVTGIQGYLGYLEGLGGSIGDIVIGPANDLTIIRTELDIDIFDDATQEYWDALLGEEMSQFKRFDAGISLGAGIYLSKLYLGLAFEQSFVNLSKSSASDFSVTNNNLTIKAGFNF